MPNERRLFDIQLELLTNELNAIGSAIRQHDEITKSIKGWAVVTWTASLRVALKESQLQPFLWLTNGNHSPGILDSRWVIPKNSAGASLLELNRLRAISIHPAL